MNAWQRFYADFLMPSRLPEYADLLAAARDHGYRFMTLPQYFLALTQSEINSAERIFLHRHDIDTDPATARKFFEAEEAAGVKASYYFRRGNLDTGLFRNVAEAGHEAGYHYEELSDFCKENNIHSTDQLRPYYTEIEKRFLQNLADMENATGHKITSIAAHGDFVNRKLQLPNHAFITPALLKRAGVQLECYHPELLKSFGYTGSDVPYPKFYRPSSPFDAVKSGVRIIYFLSHPRHWRANVLLNLKDNLQRIKEGRAYQPR